MLTNEQLDNLIAKNKLGNSLKGSSQLRGADLIKSLKSETDKPSRIKETGQDIKETIKSIGSRFKQGFEDVKTATISGRNGEQGFGSTALQSIGASAKAVGDAGSDILTGLGKTFLPQKTEEKIGKTVETFGRKIAEQPIVQKGVEKFQSLQPKTQRNLAAIYNIGEVGADIAGLGAAKFGAKAVGEVGESTIKKIGKFSRDKILKNVDNATQPNIIRGIKQTGSAIKQTGSDILARGPRLKSKVKTAIEESAERAAKIKKSSPSVAKAIKTGLDNDIIETVARSDDVTKKAYKEIVDIASTPRKGLEIKKRPSIVAGNAVENQFNLIEKQRKNIGQQIGDTVKTLSRKNKVDMSDSYKILDDTLKKQGIKIGLDKRLRFSGKFTPSERSKIQELYELALENGKKVTPKQIYDADKLFSKLQRESRLEQVGDIFVETPDGDKSLFNVFRDVFSGKLDDVSPKIKALNKDYSKYRNLVDDIENSIVKSGKFKTTRGAGQAEFAKTNLRRIMSEAQSAEDYTLILKNMDNVARELGYAGADPKVLIEFAEELKTLFPKTIPKTSFAGGIRTGIGRRDIAEKVLRAGEVGLSDKQIALKEMLDELTSKNIKTTKKVSNFGKR